MPADPSAATVPHVNTDLAVLIRRVLTDLAVVEPIAVTEAEAARLVSLSGKTLSGLPAEKTGRFHVGRAVRYHLPTLKKFAAELVGGAIEMMT